MPFPTISAYIETMRCPQGLFRTLGDPVCERDFDGEPKVRAGGSAAVFRVTVRDRDYALKCYIRPAEHARPVCEYLSTVDSGLLCRSVWLPQETFVYTSADSGVWCDVALTEWAEGRTLDFEIRKALHDGDAGRLGLMAEAFDGMAAELLAQEWAHGDIKPENIVVAPGGMMRLIDYDAVYIPALEGLRSGQTGTPGWRHPRRDEHYFNRHTDDYPLALLSATLHCLARYQSLREEYGGGDTFLFDARQAVEGESENLRGAMGMAARDGDARLYRLLRMLESPTPRIDGLRGAILSFREREKAETLLTPFSRNGIWGYEDGDGSEVIPPLFDSALEFSEGLAAVRLSEKWHFIDTAGRTVINCSGYDAVKPFSEGLAAVRRDGLWGYISSAGAEIISAQYEKASSFRDGTAKVSVGEREEQIMRTGN